MAIDVAPDLEAAIRRKIASGQYRDGNEVIRAALRTLDHDELRRSIAAGLAAAERGEARPLTPALRAEIDREADERVRLNRPPTAAVCP